jgi:hypothetical protein
MFTYADEARTFDRVGLWRTSTPTVTGVGDPEEARTIQATEGALRALGISPMLGRAFATQDARRGVRKPSF